jgi:hypothetical protein
LEAHDVTQLIDELTAQAIAQSSDEQLKMAWQLATTAEMLARLTVDQQDNGREHGVDGPGGRGRGQANGGDPAPINHSTFGHNRQEEDGPFYHATLPKMSFPKFNGANPCIWINKCCNYFTIFNILECMWPTAASLHMEDNTAKWLQVYKMKRGLGDYRKAIQDLLSLKQDGSVTDYTREFEVVEFQVSMFNTDFDITFC